MFRCVLFSVFILGIASAIPAIQTNDVNEEHFPTVHNDDQIISDITDGELDKHIENELWCPICEFLVREGEDFLSKNSTETEATNFLNKACHHLPKQKQDQCEEFVKDNYIKLFKYIIDKESAPVVCSQLHFCENDINEIDECAFCRFTAHKIENFMHGNRTLMDIINFGENFCEKHNTGNERYCEIMVPVYYSEIIQKLVDRHNFVDTCENMHFCSAETHSGLEHLAMDDNEEHHDDEEHHNDTEHQDDEEHHDDTEHHNDTEHQDDEEHH